MGDGEQRTMIRFATKDDLDLLLPMMKAFSEYSGYKDLDEEKIKQTFYEYTLTSARNDKLFLVSEDPLTSNITGFIVGLIYEPLFSREKLANEIAWWVEDNPFQHAKKLREAFEYWAQICGASKVIMSQLQNDRSKALERVYRGLGYRLAEQAFIKDLR